MVRYLLANQKKTFGRKSLEHDNTLTSLEELGSEFIVPIWKQKYQ